MYDMEIFIRRAKHQDADGIIKAHISSIRNICRKDYSSEQINAWAGRKFRADLWCQTIDRDYVWVIDDGSAILGFGHFAVMSEEVGEVMGLYFTEQALGQGLGKKMFQEMLSIARSNNLKKIILHATITAKTFYEQLGFYQSGSDDAIEMQGVPVPCFPMEYIL
jgi:putative acetyltransferase